jgi:GNAT superfamily N-acetyltransferase
MQNQIQFQALQDNHDTEGFSCGVDALDQWLKRIARQHISKGVSRTFVAIDPVNVAQILGYYSLTVAEIDTDKLPKDIARKLPRRVPLVLIGRLATALAARGQGIGALLLVDALKRIVRVANDVGVTLVLVDAKDDPAASFYRHFGFVPLPDTPLRLALAVDTAKRAMTSAPTTLL